MQETWNHKVTWGCWMKKGNTFKASEPLQNEHLLLTRAFKLFNKFPNKLFCLLLYKQKVLHNSQDPCQKEKKKGSSWRDF